MLFPPARQFFSSLIDGCLKYKNKEKPKTGPRPDPRLNYDVKIGLKPGPRGVKKLGPIGPGLKCRALAFPSVEIRFVYVCVFMHELYVRFGTISPSFGCLQSTVSCDFTLIFKIV